MYEIITIPYNSVTKSFHSDDLNGFCMNKRVLSSKIEFFHDAKQAYWTVFIEYETVLESIIEAIYAKEKADILRRANLYMEKIRALLQISVDKKYISIGQYGHISGEINEAGKMIGGWIKSCGE